MQFADSTRKLIENLKTSPEMHARGAAIKRQIIEHLRTKPYYAALWNDIKNRILADVASDQSRLREAASSLLNALGSGLARDEAMQHKLNEWLQGALETLMLAHRHQISLLITDVVKSWDARDVSEKIELEIGKDLQYIRLNGTLVGGCVGVLLHLLVHAAWLPAVRSHGPSSGRNLPRRVDARTRNRTLKRLRVRPRAVPSRKAANDL